MKASVLELAQVLARGELPLAIAEHEYGLVLTELGFVEFACEAATVMFERMVDGTISPTIALDREVGEVLFVLWGARTLGMETKENLDASAGPGWRTKVGKPVVWVKEASRELRLYPIPDLASEPFVPFHGAPLGEDFPHQTALLIHSKVTEDLPDWSDLYVTLRTLARTYSVLSKWQDLPFAQMCLRLANMAEAAVLRV